jgi:hypothetical protein
MWRKKGKGGRCHSGDTNPYADSDTGTDIGCHFNTSSDFHSGSTPDWCKNIDFAVSLSVK